MARLKKKRLKMANEEKNAGINISPDETNQSLSKEQDEAGENDLLSSKALEDDLELEGDLDKLPI